MQSWEKEYKKIKAVFQQTVCVYRCWALELRTNVVQMMMMMSHAVSVIGQMFHAHHLRCTRCPRDPFLGRSRVGNVWNLALVRPRSSDLSFSRTSGDASPRLSSSEPLVWTLIAVDSHLASGRNLPFRWGMLALKQNCGQRDAQERTRTRDLRI